MEDPIHERGKAIEDLFFKQKDQQLLEKLKQEMASEQSRDALAAASGVHDPAVLDSLQGHGITPETLTTIGLIPLVAVAWADSVLSESEKNAILQAADISGISIGTAAHDVLDNWLGKKPSADLLESWKAYIHSLKSTLAPAELTQIKLQILQRAETVAEAAGGFLGLGNKISDAEKDVLDELNRAFE